MRFAIGMTGLAAVTAIATAVIRSPAPAQVVLPATADTATPPPAAPPALIHLRSVTRYVQLKPGQTAPPGAKVVQSPDPSPRTVIVTVPAPAPPAAVAAPRRVVVVTRQSGTK